MDFFFKKSWELDVNKACTDVAWSAVCWSHSCHSREERLGSAAGVKGARLRGSRCSSTEPLEWKMMFVTSSASCGDPSLSALTGAAAWCKA